MAETLETGSLLAPPRFAPAPPPLSVPPYLAPAKPRFTSLGASVSAALAERRLALLLPFAMIVGLIASVELPADPHPVALAAGAAAIGLMLALSLRTPTRLRLASVLAAAWLGFSLLPIHGAMFGSPMLARPAYGTYQARVDEVLSETVTETRVILSGITPVGADRPVPVRRARVVIKAGPDLSPGDVISGQFRFAPVPGPVYPGGFDTQFQSYFDGVGAYGNSIKPPILVTLGDEAAPAHIVDAARRGISMRIDAVLSEPAAGIARAIVNGDQSAVTDDARTTMATAGIAHVLSVSGLHLTIVAGGVFWVVRLLLSGFDGLARRVSVKRVAAVAGIGSALFYFAVSGGNVAALRSTLMILLVFGAVLFGRRALTMRNVAIAGIIVIATDPASVFRPSFQLSFAAVVALVGVYENLRSERNRDVGVLAHAWGYGKGIVVTSLVAGAATLLFSIYHFQQTSPLGVVGNLATLPLVGFVMMPAAAIAMLLMPFGLEGPPLLAMGWSIERMLDVARVVADWSTHLRAAPLLTPWALVFGLVGLAWFAFFKDRWRLLGPALVVPLVAIFAVDQPPDVLIADTTQAIAIRGPSGLELADGKPQSFALNIWRETYAEPIDRQAAESCDSLACVGTSAAGFTYAIVSDPAALPDECGHADLLVVRGASPSWCTAKALVTADDLARHGVRWLRWDAARQGFEVRPAISMLGRPWRIAR
ncbi:MAG TPA: ComEC/Rec2 family competence protein [Devosia sp.]|nr:ComEC/Rec2 family competence protein [Devosia sp.]